MLNGLYKVEYGVNDAFGRSIMCMHNGKLLGGNSAFAHLGAYQESGGASCEATRFVLKAAPHRGPAPCSGLS